MRIAVSGKGGTGKTTIAGLMSRLYGRSGRPVLALDADSNPNLAICLGLPHSNSDQIEAVPGSLAEWRTDDHDRAFVNLTIALPHVRERYGVSAPDNVTLLVMGTVDHAGVGCRCSAHAAARGIMGHLLQADAPVVIADMEAGLEHLGRGTTEHADALLIIVEPYYRALETGRRVQALAHELGIPHIYTVANKVRTVTEEDAVRAFCDQHGLNLIATLPFDEELLAAEANGTTILDADPQSPLVQATTILADTIVEILNGTLR